jgi:hypothetical protein
MKSADELRNWNPVMNFTLPNFMVTESFRLLFCLKLVILNVIFKRCGDFLRDQY